MVATRGGEAGTCRNVANITRACEACDTTISRVFTRWNASVTLVYFASPVAKAISSAPQTGIGFNLEPQSDLMRER